MIINVIIPPKQVPIQGLGDLQNNVRTQKDPQVERNSAKDKYPMSDIL